MNGSTFILYTTSTGGLWNVIRATEGEYQEAIESGQLDVTPEWMDVPRGTDMIDLKFIALLRAEANHDFVLGGDRDDPSTWVEQHRSAIA